MKIEPIRIVEINQHFNGKTSEYLSVNAIPSDGISKGIIDLRQVFNLSGGSAIPFGVAYLSDQYKDMMARCVQDITTLDKKIRSGFEGLFRKAPDRAADIIRRSFNVNEGENVFLETLVETLAAKPELSHLRTILYRVDGLNGGDRIVVNEINANPIGAFWLNELYATTKHKNYGFGIDAIPQTFIKKIREHTDKDHAYFLPVRDIRGPSSYTEKLILRDFLSDLDIDFFMGVPENLEFAQDGIYVTWENDRKKIGYIGGLSSPEIFMKVPQLLTHVRDGNVHCPSAIDNIIGLGNKGMFCVVTDMKEGRLDPALLGLSSEDFNSSPIPNTYRLYDRVANTDNTPLFKNRNMVAKPIEGVGGKGILFSKDLKTVEAFDQNEQRTHLIQDYYPSFEATAGQNMFASLDPYFTPEEGKIMGVLVRSSIQGFLPNLTINSKRGDSVVKPANLFSLGVEYGH